MQNRTDKKVSGVLGREGKITVLSLLKNFYEVEIFHLLVKEFYESDVGVSEAAIRASGSLGNEIAIPHLYQIVERGTKPQRIAAIQALTAIRAPSSTGMLITYFNHFPEDDLRAEILKAINAISPTAEQVQELNHAVLLDPKQGETVKRFAVEALVEAERYPLLKEILPRSAASVQEAAITRLLQSGNQEFPDLTGEALSPTALGCFLCVYTLKAKPLQFQPAYVLSKLQSGRKETLVPFLLSLSRFQGRLHYPTRVFRLLLKTPHVDAESEALVGDFLRKIVKEVKDNIPQLLSEFSVTTSMSLETVFSKVMKNFISMKGINNKETLLSSILAGLLEKYATPAVLEDVQRFFKAEFAGMTPPVAALKALLAEAPEEDQNRLKAVIPLFSLTEKKEKIQVMSVLSKADLNRPIYVRRLNRLIRVAGALSIKTTSRKIQEILEFARQEKIAFLEETAIVTLCQLLTRSIIEQSKEYFSQPTRNIRSLNGYIRGSRFIPPKIMMGPLLHVLLHPALNADSRALVVDTLAVMELSGLKRMMPSLMKALDMPEVDAEVKLRIGELISRFGDASIGHQLLDITGHADPVARRAAIRALRALAARGEGISAEVLNNRLYLLLDDKDRSVKLEALQALLALSDDYAVQIVGDYVEAGDGGMVAEILSGIAKPRSRETFSLVMGMLSMESAPVQQSLRELLPELSQGDFAAELRQSLVESLSTLPRIGAAAGTAGPAAPRLPEESVLGQAKLEFKFKRENTQVLTVFFIDVAGSTELSNRADYSSYLKLIEAFEDIVTSELAAHRGVIVKKMGDGILAVFKQPINAVISALKIQGRIGEYNSMRVDDKFMVRIGLNTGRVTRKDGDVFGPVVNVASRMQSSAEPGEIQMTEATFQEVKDYVRCIELGRIQVKGVAEAITAYSPEELTVDMHKITADGGKPGEGGETPLEKLKQSAFVPEFGIPHDLTTGREIAGFLRGLFSDIVRAVEEVASDYHDEYEFKKYLQDKWNELLGKL